MVENEIYIMKFSKSKQWKATPNSVSLTVKKTPSEIEQAMWDKYYEAEREFDKAFIPALLPNANSYLIKRCGIINSALGAKVRVLKHDLVTRVKRVEKAYPGFANSPKRNDEISLTTINYLLAVIKEYKAALAEVKEAIEESKV